MDLNKYIQEGLSWEEYVSHIENVIETGDKSDEKYQYYPLNLKRMERWAKKGELNEEQKEKLSQLNKKVTFLMITEGWCGDAAQVLPIVHLLVENSENLSEAINLRDSNDLIESYLTNGGKSIPIVVAVDTQTGEELFHWGPRPAWASDILKRYKAGETTHDEFALELQKMYNQDKGQSIINEILDHLV